MIEFLPWYVTGASMVRCEGDDGCGTLLLEADAEKHVKWHKKVEAVAALESRRDGLHVKGK